jgi:glutathione S-transferase
MGELTVTTFDWVPELPRGYVRDLRVRWALEEAGLSYRVEGVSFANKTRNGEPSLDHFPILRPQK